MASPPDPCLAPGHVGRGMPSPAFRAAATATIDFIVDYYERRLEGRGDAPPLPVRSRVAPGYLRPLLRDEPPEEGEAFDAVLADLEAHILPGVTHWQSPSFFAYYPANASYPGILGELLSAGLNTIGFSWIGSPAATELEVILLDQLASALGLPPRFLSPDAPPASPGRTGGGVIQCTASDAVLVALLAARARVREREGAGAGASPEAVYAVDARLVVYTSDQAHSCVVKAAMVAGVLRVRALPTTAGDGFALAPATLAAAVAADVDAGLLPTLVVATLGTTSTCAVDPVDELAAVAAAAGAWTHVDAAYAGVFMLAPSLRPAFAFAAVDSFSTNMHKSGMVNFDCSPMWVADAAPLRLALSLTPASLTPVMRHAHNALDLRDWQVPLGRRFRALKLWCVLRVAGLAGLRAHLATCAALAARAAARVAADTRFTLLPGSPSFGLVCFALAPPAPAGAAARVVERVNAGGGAFLVTTEAGVISGLIRLAVGCPATRSEHVDGVLDALAAAVDAERGQGWW